MANKPNNPSLWSRAKSMARQKFDVYPSAYANGWAAKYYKSKGGTWRKGEQGMYMKDGGKMFDVGGTSLTSSIPGPFSASSKNKTTVSFPQTVGEYMKLIGANPKYKGLDSSSILPFYSKDKSTWPKSLDIIEESCSEPGKCGKTLKYSISATPITYNWSSSKPATKPAVNPTITSKTTASKPTPKTTSGGTSCPSGKTWSSEFNRCVNSYEDNYLKGLKKEREEIVGLYKTGADKSLIDSRTKAFKEKYKKESGEPVQLFCDKYDCNIPVETSSSTTTTNTIPNIPSKKLDKSYLLVVPGLNNNDVQMKIDYQDDLDRAVAEFKITPEQLNYTDRILKVDKKKWDPYKLDVYKYPSVDDYLKKTYTKGRFNYGGKVSVKAGGENHVIYKKETKQGEGKVGNIMVNHPTMDKGKWDTIDLTAMNKKINTVKKGVAATKKWHKENPYPKKKMQVGAINNNPFGNTSSPYLRPTIPSVFAPKEAEPEETTPSYIPQSRREKRTAYENLVRSSAYPVMKTRPSGQEYESRDATMRKLLGASKEESGMNFRQRRRLGQDIFGEPRKETMADYRKWYPASSFNTSGQNANRPLANKFRRIGELARIAGSKGPGKCFGGDCNKMKLGGLTPAQKAASKLAMNMKGKVIGSDRMLKHGGMFAVGGPIKPIYVSNPNDSRLRRYNDSLYAYNMGERNYASALNRMRSHANDINKRRRFWEPELVVTQETKRPSKGFDYRGINPISWVNVTARPDENAFFKDLREDYLTKTGWEEGGTRYRSAAAARYKKPSQPVIYKPNKVNTLSSKPSTVKKKPKTSASTTVVKKPISSTASTTTEKSTTTAPTKSSSITINPTTSTSTTKATTSRETTPKVAPTAPTQPRKTVELYTQPPIYQRFQYMSRENRHKAVSKYGDPSTWPTQGIDIRTLKNGGKTSKLKKAYFNRY